MESSQDVSISGVKECYKKFITHDIKGEHDMLLLNTNMQVN